MVNYYVKVGLFRLVFYAPLRDALRSTVRDLDLIIISILTTVSYCAFALWLCASPVSVAIVRAVDVTNDARTNASHGQSDLLLRPPTGDSLHPGSRVRRPRPHHH